MIQPVLALTTGEPAGIGPELALMLAAEGFAGAASGAGVAPDFSVVAVGDPSLLEARAQELGLGVTVKVLAPGETPPAPRPGVLPVWPVALKAPCRVGELDPANGAYVLETLDLAGVLLRVAAKCDHSPALAASEKHSGHGWDGWICQRPGHEGGEGTGTFGDGQS